MVEYSLSGGVLDLHEETGLELLSKIYLSTNIYQKYFLKKNFGGIAQGIDGGIPQKKI